MNTKVMGHLTGAIFEEGDLLESRIAAIFVLYVTNLICLESFTKAILELLLNHFVLGLGQDAMENKLDLIVLVLSHTSHLGKSSVFVRLECGYF